MWPLLGAEVGVAPSGFACPVTLSVPAFRGILLWALEMGAGQLRSLHTSIAFAVRREARLLRSDNQQSLETTFTTGAASQAPSKHFDRQNHFLLPRGIPHEASQCIL